MPGAKMKPLLALSKKEPVQAAIGLTADGDGIILLDKKAKPKKVASLLKSAAGKAKLQLNSASLNANFTNRTVDASANFSINGQTWNGAANGMPIYRHQYFAAYAGTPIQDRRPGVGGCHPAVRGRELAGQRDC